MSLLASRSRRVCPGRPVAAESQACRRVRACVGIVLITVSGGAGGVSAGVLVCACMSVMLITVSGMALQVVSERVCLCAQIWTLCWSQWVAWQVASELVCLCVGIVLITVSGVAWRLTAHDAPSCRSMLGLGGGTEAGAEPNRRFVPRLPPSYGRPHHPYAAMMYPEFQYRPPPPSYQASMQEYRLRLLLLDRQPGGPVLPAHTVSPPPTYRSHAGSTLRAPLGMRRGETLQSDYSRPPSYRSRTSSTRPPLDPSVHSASEHSRDPSLSVSDPGAVVSVISVGGADSVKLAPADDPPAMSLKAAKEGGNLVTIVQTAGESSPVIVTVSGSSSSQPPPLDTEMEILAHL
ncbi:hypothetical protein PR048_009058 [Dryococelus australis]|uniref:Uncharacterized protein n=1 Tax=Dryococelus australis TaxID=614101 RepID=A0ABQ9HYU8_9NEOP|nr:hypothetical protein PR048_009058 [Dryococelus australis]